MSKKLKMLFLVILLCIPYGRANAQAIDNYKIISSEKDNYALEYEFFKNSTNKEAFAVGETLINYGIRAMVHIDGRFISSYSSWDSSDYVIKRGWQEVTVTTKTPIYGKFKVVLSIYGTDNGEEVSNLAKISGETTPVEEIPLPRLSTYSIILDTDMNYDLNVDNVDNAKAIVWESSNTKVVIVDKSSGVITAIKKGNAIIKCRITTSANVEEVIEANVNVGYSDSIPILTAKNLDLEKGENFDINVENKISKSTYLWTSSDKSIAKVKSVNGVVTAVSNGKAIIYCTITTPNKEIVLLKCEVVIE